MSALLTKLVNTRTGPLVSGIQQFLFTRALAYAEGKRDEKKDEQRFCEFCTDYMKHRREQFDASGARDRTRKKFHPSSMGGCMRASWFDLMGAPANLPHDAEDSARTSMIFRNGDFVHLRLQWLLHEMGWLASYEVPLEDTANDIEGHCDGILSKPKRAVLEIKSINDRGFVSVEKAGAAKPEHVDQANRYMNLTGCDEAVILYECKNDQRLREFWITRDKQAYAEDLKVIRELSSYVRMRKVPQREGSTPSCDVCRWCGYTKLCYDAEAVKRFVSGNAVAPAKPGRLRVLLARRPK